MRYKVVPEPCEVETLRAVHAALPLVPDTVEDCCVRVVDRTGVAARDDAREWLTFCQALGLARETDRGFERVRTDPDREGLAAAFQENLVGVPALLMALEEADSLTAVAAYPHLRPTVPRWERERHTDWEATWRERTRRLLEWGVAFGLLERDGDRYRRI